MTLQQMIYFKEVAEQQHFTRAADKLFVAQSSLSHSIRLLEEELGVPLLYRKNGKRVELSAYGEEFLTSVKQILDSVEEAKARIDRMRNPASGIVNVVYSYINGCTLMPKVFNAFYEEFPEREIEIRVAVNHASRKFEDELKDGKIDLAFSCTPSANGLESALIAVQDLYVFVPKDHPLAEQGTVVLEELENEPLLMHHQGRNLYRRILQMFAYSGLLPNIEEVFEEWSAQMVALTLGQGIVISPLVPVDPELVKALKLEHPMARRGFYMHWQADRELSLPVKTLRDFCIDYFTARNGEPIHLAYE